jgi:thioesterase domain-containing protein
LLFQETTIERLATVLRQQQIPRGESSLVGLQTSGLKPPLFFIHAGGGSVFCYVTLARYLGKDQPTYGLQTPGLYGDREPYTDLQELATHYIQEIRSVQPEGPYHLGGWCGGGIIAYEMARQLQHAGQKVALLILLDSAPPCAGNAPDHDDALFLLAGFAGDLLRLLGEQIPASYKSALLELLVSVMSASGNQAIDANQVTMFMAYLLAERQGSDMIAVYESLKQLTPDQRWQRLVTRAGETQMDSLDADLAHLRRLYLIYCSNARAIYGYVPQVYLGKIALFCASDKEANTQREEASAWQKWTTEQVSLYSAPGDHYTMLKEPNVQILAGKLKEQLELSRWDSSDEWPLSNQQKKIEPSHTRVTETNEYESMIAITKKDRYGAV